MKVNDIGMQEVVYEESLHFCSPIRFTNYKEYFSAINLWSTGEFILNNLIVIPYTLHGLT